MLFLHRFFRYISFMINFKHLNYFLVVAQEGSIAKASQLLNVTPQTISGQLCVLESQLNVKLFHRVGRNLELSETGYLILNYAEEIFSLGGELEEMVRKIPVDKQVLFNVGVTDMVPKSIAYRLIAPVLELSEKPMRVFCREGSVESLLSDLALHKLDMVICGAPSPHQSGRVYVKKVGECGVSFFATPQLAKQLVGDFPHCLDGVPFLFPSERNGIRSSLKQWLDDMCVYPKIAGEFDDSALLKSFGQGGLGVFMAPSAIEEEIMKKYEVVKVGDTRAVIEPFFTISVKRKIPHPEITLINQQASEWLNV